MARVTSLQRRYDEGTLVLPDTRPASVSARGWAVLVRHVRDRVPYAALAAEWQLSEETTRGLAIRAAAALHYPDLADLPGQLRRLLVRGGYTTREAIARASDADLLLLKGLNTGRLRAIRAVVPRAE